MTLKDIYDSMTEEQKSVVCFIVSEAVHNVEVKKNREIGVLKRKINKLEKAKVCCKNCVNFFEANAFNWPEYDCLKSGKDITYPEALTHCKDFVKK